MGNFAERLNLDENFDNLISNEHLVRYQLAGQAVKGKTVLDIATGSGYGAKYLQAVGAHKVVGVDIDAQTIAHNQKKYGDQIEFLVGDATALSFASQEFDCLTSFETIEHLAQPEKYLAELKRVLKVDGLAFISTPNKDIFQEQNPYHLHEFNKSEFEQLLKQYFTHVLIIEQYNTLGSYLVVNKDKFQVEITSASEPWYFVAICSQTEIAGLWTPENFASFNGRALIKLYGNPGWKLVNSAYRLATKVPGVKKLFKMFSK